MNRVVAGGLTLLTAALLGAGCGQATSAGSGKPSGGLVYHVTISGRGLPREMLEEVESDDWIDPAGNRYRVLSHVSGGHGAPQPILDVGAPGVNLERIAFPHGSFAGTPSSETTLSYGGAALGLVGPDPAGEALTVLRAYLHLPVRHAPRFRVEHGGGHTELVAAFAPLPPRALKLTDVPPKFRRMLKRMARAQVVITIDGAITQTAAADRGLFRIDSSKADEVIRSLRPGVAPAGPRPAYWLGPSWAGGTAGNCTSDVSNGRSPFGGHDSYDVSYGHSVSAGLDIQTIAMPHMPPAARKHLFPGMGRLQQIRLADGTRAWFSYGRFSLNSGAITRVSSTYGPGVTAATGSATSSGGSAPPSSFKPPPMVMVFTGGTQIIINGPPALTRGQALAIARALRPV